MSIILFEYNLILIMLVSSINVRINSFIFDMLIYYLYDIYVMSNITQVNRKVNNYNKQLLSQLEQHDITTQYDYKVSKSIKERYVLLKNKMIYVLVNNINHQSTFRHDQLELIKSLSFSVCRYDKITNNWIISL